MTYWAIGGFGAVGAILRYTLGALTLTWWNGDFPLATLIVNMLGCMALGWLTAIFSASPNMPLWLNAGLRTGLIGAFTTFSAFSAETLLLIREGLLVTGFCYVGLSLLAGAASTRLGLWLGEG